MILQRLHELAVREQLTQDPAFVSKDVACSIEIGDDGQYLGLRDLRQSIELKPKSAKGKPKTILNNGLPFLLPIRPVVWDEKIAGWKLTDPASSGKEKPAVFMADTIGRVLPVTGLLPAEQIEKFRAQRSTFWRFLAFSIKHSNAIELQPLIEFIERAESDNAFDDQLCNDVEAKKFTISNLCTLAVHSQGGRTILESESLTKFWREFFQKSQQSQERGAFQGLCQVTGLRAPLASSIKSRLKGLVSIGCRADAYLVTGLNSAESYNLDGTHNAMISEVGVDSFTRAANALIGNDLAGNRTSFRVGGVMFLFWTRRGSESGACDLFEPDSASIEYLLKSAAGGSLTDSVEQPDDFYMLTISGNSARVVVRDYLETPVARVKRDVRQWFFDLRIADATFNGQGMPTSFFPLWQLANATALDADAVSPDVPSYLMFAAIEAAPVPESVLIACLRRLRAEGASGFRTPARLALIKLILIRQGVPMTETLDLDEKHHAYLFGRLLHVFEQIQYAALGDVNANVVDKFYGVYSTAPSLVFNRLLGNAQNHLRKVKSEKAGLAHILQERLTEITKYLPPAPPPGIMSVRDQGRFAIGYYHERAKNVEERESRKAEKLEKAASKISGNSAIQSQSDA